MALPNRLWLPDGGHELPTWIPETPRSTAEQAVSPLGQRWRRRAVLAGAEGQPERTVLVEWFAVADLLPSQIEPLRGFCHVNLLRLHQFGQSDGKTAYAISEAPLGLDLGSIVKTAQVKLPTWWAVAVLGEVARGLLALHQFLAGRRLFRGHGAVDAQCVFVSASGRVQVLAFAPLLKVAHTDDTIAPEVRHGQRLVTPAADVYSLAKLLAAMPLDRALPDGLQRLLQRALSLHAEKRPTLAVLSEVLEHTRWQLGAPLAVAERIGSELNRLLPPTRSRDLADGDWGSAGPVTFGPLPKTLFLLSSTAVSLSATWDAAPPLALTVKPQRSWSWTSVAIATVSVLLPMLGGSALGWLFDREEPLLQPLRSVVPAVVQAPAIVPVPVTPSSTLASSLALREGERGLLGQVRCQVLRSEQGDGGPRLTLLLVNGTTLPHQIDPMSLRIGSSSDTQSFSPEPLPPLRLGPGQMQTVELRFVVTGLSLGGLRLWLQR